VAINREKVLLEAQKLVDKKKFDKAIAEYQKVVADDPNDVRTLLKIGDIHLRLQQFSEAIGTYDRVAQFYSTQGFSVKAVAVFKQMREIIQKHAPHLEDRFGHIVPKLAELLTQLDLRSDALAYYDEWASRLQAAGRERDAIDIFKKIVSLDSMNPVSHLRLADAFARVRDIDGAAIEFGQAAELLMEIGRQDDALRVVERLLQYRQESRFARLAAEIHLQRGQANDGMAALTKLQIAFKENPRDLETLSLLSRAFDALGQPAKSIEVQKEACRIARESGNAAGFQAILATLLQRAPHDEGVRQLVAMAAGEDSKASSLPPAGSVRPPSNALYGALADRREGAPLTQAPASSVELSQSDIVVDDIDEDVVAIDSEVSYRPEPGSEDVEEAPFALRASHPPHEEDPVRMELARAEAHRQHGDYVGAETALREAAAAFPEARELRERLCDVLIESGDQDAAVGEMLGFARQLVDVGDPDAAARLLDEVLLLETHQPVALAMLRELGYAVPGAEVSEGFAPAEFAPAEEIYAEESVGERPVVSLPAYDPLEPLPGYDLDELTADELPPVDSLSSPATTMRSRAASSGGTAPPIQLDDPFEVDEVSLAVPAYPVEAPAAPGSRRSLSPGLDEAALEEIEFFATHDMLDEAMNLLQEQLARLPNHPILLEKMREIEALRGAGTAPAPLDTVPPQPLSTAHPRSSATRELSMVDRAYDIAHALDEMDHAMESFGPVEQAPEMGSQVSVEAVFEQFKAGVAAQIAEGDAATHYDLGVAYKEMGLTQDAIHEFELASRDPTRECVCQSMIGMLHLSNGNLDGAIDAFIRGLHASEKTPDQELALTYEIGNAYEMRNNLEQSVYYFQLVARTDPSYRDPRGTVAERIAALERSMGGVVHAAPAVPRAVGGDEFDAAFDDLFNPKG
jgi:tetratricopeptide (TPR) repeat protein